MVFVSQHYLGKLEQLISGVGESTVCNKQTSKVVDLDVYESKNVSKIVDLDTYETWGNNNSKQSSFSCCLKQSCDEGR